MDRRPERAPLDCYLDRICRRLWLVPARERRDTREELRQHLEKMAAHAARTVEPTAAMEDAMEKFGDPKEIGNELSKQHLRRRRWLSVLLKTAAGAALTLLIVTIGYSSYWYFALSRPMEQEAVPVPIASAATTLTAIQAAQDGYARQIQSVRFRGTSTGRSYFGNKYTGEFTHTYEVASKGSLYYSREVADERYGTRPDETSHSDDIYIFHGQTMREVMTDWNGPAGSARAKQTHGVSAYLPGGKYKPHDPDEVLQYGYKVGSAWIGDMLRRGQPVVEGIVIDAQFGPLTVVRCRNKTSWGTPETVRLWLAPNLGWLAVRSEIDLESAGPNLPIRQTRATRSVARSGPYWVTAEANLAGDYIALGRRQQLGKYPKHFTDIVFNDVPASLFVPNYPAGTRFWTLATDAHPSVPTTFERYQEAPPVAADSVFSLWLYELTGVIALGGVGFAVLRARRRGRGLTA